MKISKVDIAYILSSLLFVIENFDIYFYINKKRLTISMILKNKSNDKEKAMIEIKSTIYEKFKSLSEKFSDELRKAG